MSALGQKQTSDYRLLMSALPPKADMRSADRRVRFGPGADSCTAARSILFDHLVGAAAQRQRHGDAERSGGLDVDVQFDFRCLLDRQIGRLLTLEDTAGIDTNQ